MSWTRAVVLVLIVSATMVGTTAVSSGQQACNTVDPCTITLGELSEHGPTLTSFKGRLYLAWTGTDEHLNIISSSDGQSFSQKVVLSDISEHAPALAVFRGRLYLAWTGMDGHLNIFSSSDGIQFGGKVTLGERSNNGPALVSHRGRLIIGWTGTDDRLNVIATGDGQAFHADRDKETLNERSDHGPALASFDDRLVLTWAGTDEHLNLLFSTNGRSFSGKITSSETSKHGPAFAGGYLLWTGTDEQLNYLDLRSNTKTTIGEKSQHSTAAAVYNGRLYLGWAGTDEHLNVRDGPPVPVFDIDRDGDGLLDSWERFGYDDDGDGVIDVDLPAMGADPNHKDLFLEVDWVPGTTLDQHDVQMVRDAFAAAPVWAGGLPNPDGRPGITLHIDTGTLTDSAGNPVGDDLGGGNQLGTTLFCNLDPQFYVYKQANFNRSRLPIFRYAISTPATADCNSGGQAEIGGNDFVEHNGDGGTLMHELGHTLNLRHGGNVDDNCKPNYVSVMNYDLQFGITQLIGGIQTTILDYSPPRFAGGRGIAPLLTLDEGALSEAAALDQTDSNNFFTFTSPTKSKVLAPLNQAPDWNQNNKTDSGTLSGNIDVADASNSPAGCTGNTGLTTLTGYDDWSNIVLPALLFGDRDDAALNPVLEHELTTQELIRQREAVNTTDLAVVISDLPDPVAAGDLLTYTLKATSLGPNPAFQTVASAQLPAGVTYVSDTGTCAPAGLAVRDCNLGALLDGAERQLELVVRVDSDLVYRNGGPLTIDAGSTVSNLAGPDPQPANNAASTSTRVVASADLALTVAEARGVPSQATLGQPIRVGLHVEYSSAGPSSPIDVSVDTASITTAGSQLSAAAQTTGVALRNGETRALDLEATIVCAQTGMQTFAADIAIRPLRPEDGDPVDTNNRQRVSFALDCTSRVTDGLAALYTFEEGSGAVVHDSAGARLNLVVDNPAAVGWVRGGLVISSSTLLSSRAPATPLIEDVRRSGEITLEAWVVPAAHQLRDLGRVISIAPDAGTRNVSLMQRAESQPKTAFIARLRFGEGNPAGRSPLQARRVSPQSSLVHLVYSRDAAGIERFFIDGVLRARRIAPGSFDGWDPSYPLTLANVVTGDRPWLGEYQLAAIYGRALSPAEAAQNFRAGPSGHATRVAAGLQSLYTFQEGSGTTIYDRSGSADGLDLQIGSPEATAWSSGGLVISGTATIASALPMTRVIGAIQASGELALEAWVLPLSSTLAAPADLMALSSGRDRWLALTQSAPSADESRYVVWAQTSRTTATGPALRSLRGSATPTLTHVLYTRDAKGNVRLYINGVERSRGTVPGSFRPWDPDAHLVLAGSTGEALWPGVYRLLALYSRALSATEVRQNYEAGPSGFGVDWMTGAKVRYEFEEGAGDVVRDTSGVGAPLDLTIEDVSKTQWIAGGLVLSGTTVVSSSAAATKLIASAAASNEVAVEAWVRPAGPSVAQPGQIVSLSAAPRYRDLSFMQWKDDQSGRFVTRLRTSETSLDGMPSWSPSRSATADLMCLVFTRDASGMTRFYINGAEVGRETVRGSLKAWSPLSQFALGDEFTRDRAWLGEYQRLVVYNRALSPAEIRARFQAGPSAP